MTTTQTPRAVTRDTARGSTPEAALSGKQPASGVEPTEKQRGRHDLHGPATSPTKQGVYAMTRTADAIAGVLLTLTLVAIFAFALLVVSWA